MYHFENGVKWFGYVCGQDGKDVGEMCKKLMERKEFRNLGLEEIMKQVSKCQ